MDNINYPVSGYRQPANIKGPSDRLRRIRMFCMSRQFMLLTALAGLLFISLQAEVAGVIFLILLTSAVLIICDDILATTLPVLILSISVLQCYDSFDTFIKFAGLAVIPVAALLFHFIKYKGKLQIGASVWGLLAVAVSVTLGGFGAIEIEEYSAPVALYYVAGLGFGLVGTYLLIKSQIHFREDYDIREKFIDIMYIMGMFAAIHMVEIYIELLVLQPQQTTLTDVLNLIINDDYKGDGFYYRKVQPGNNISTFIMFALPFPFYRALKGSKNHIWSAAFMMFVLYISKSRGGLILGGLVLLVCIFFFGIYSKSKFWSAAPIVFFSLVVGAALTYVIINNSPESIGGIISTDEQRVRLVIRSFEDFFSNPLFGQGIGNTSNADIYNGKAGTVCWYHMMIPQIIGSMGICGILGYGIQLAVRIWLTIRKYSAFVITLALSYFGLFMMSQVNPGEFCPIPYGLIAVILFIMIENEPDTPPKVKVKKSKRKKNTITEEQEELASDVE